MGETKIEWAHYTFNPWIGCAKLGPECDNCYAADWGKRFGVAWGPHEPRKRTADSTWKLPRKWDDKAEKAGERYRVFCASLADIGDGEMDDEDRHEVMSLAYETPNLDWLLLSKRPRVLRSYAAAFGWPPNAWAGTTIGVKSSLYRLDELRRIPAPVRFLSVEPLLEDLGVIDLTGIHWVIVGGESGSKARPSHPAWFRSLRNQCHNFQVPFLFKQWGEWAPVTHVPEGIKPKEVCTVDSGTGHRELMWRVGKKSAGRLLDGREWNEVPNAAV